MAGASVHPTARGGKRGCAHQPPFTTARVFGEGAGARYWKIGSPQGGTRCNFVLDLPLFCSRPAVDSTSTDTTVKIVFRASGKADLTSRTTLATRLAVGAALVALIPLIALALTFMVLAERAMRKQVDAALLAKAQSFAVLIQSSILDPLSHENALRAWVADRRVATAFGAPRARDACSQFLAAAIRGRMV